MAQQIPLPLTVSYFSEIQIGFIFLVPAHSGSSGQRAVKWVCVCVCVYLSLFLPTAGRSFYYEQLHLLGQGSGRVSWHWERHLVVKIYENCADPHSCMGQMQGCSGVGTRWNSVPANILEPEQRSGKYRPQVER